MKKIKKSVPGNQEPAFQCTACDSTTYDVLTTLPPLYFNGTRDGVPYSDIVWSRVRCKTCGQAAMLKTYNHESK